MKLSVDAATHKLRKVEPEGKMKGLKQTRATFWINNRGSVFTMLEKI